MPLLVLVPVLALELVSRSEFAGSGAGGSSAEKGTDVNTALDDGGDDNGGSGSAMDLIKAM